MSTVSPTSDHSKIKFLGGAKQVGRSAVALSKEGKTILLDYGVLVGEEPGFPVHIPPRDVAGIVLTHAHLDHSGGIPLFHIGNRTPVYGSALTFELSKLLITDFIKLASYYLPYEYLELQSMMESRIEVEPGKEYKVAGFGLKFLEAGHIPGSLQGIVDIGGGKRLAYTGDINTKETKLLSGADTNYGELRALIVESTYANGDHPERKSMERTFVDRVREVVERGGTALIPAFSVGRSQEILCILRENEFKHPVIVDGLALNVNQVMLKYPNSFRDFNLLKRALEEAKWINDWRERREATKTPCAIVSPAGMLMGGASAFYLDRVAKQKKNAIFLVSFQVPGTPGRTLLEKGKVMIRGRPEKVEAEVERFDLSSHCGKTDIENLLRGVKGNPEVFVMHGSPENCQSLAEWVRKEVGLTAYAPEPGEVYKL